jgi:hypothetical protein
MKAVMGTTDDEGSEIVGELLARDDPATGVHLAARPDVELGVTA